MQQHLIAVFGASAAQPGDEHYQEGVQCGRLLAERGFGVVTGGYGGLMEAVSRGAADAGGRAIGVTAPTVFPGRNEPNPFVTEELRAASLTERIHELTSIAAGSIALHGSIGTLTELVVAWNLAFVSRFSSTSPKPVVAVGPRWAELIPHLAAVLDTEDDLVRVAADVPGAVDVMADLLG